MLYVDRDEFLHCPVNYQKNTLTLQSDFQSKFFRNFQQKHISGCQLIYTFIYLLFITIRS